jgi:hypothetical protein
VNVSVSVALSTSLALMEKPGVGFVGTLCVAVTLPLASVFVATTPLVTVVDPLTPDSPAAQVAPTTSAENCPPLAVEMAWIVDELVAEPPAPTEPCALTSTSPDSKSVAGP